MDDPTLTALICSGLVWIWQHTLLPPKIRTPCKLTKPKQPPPTDPHDQP